MRGVCISPLVRSLPYGRQQNVGVGPRRANREITRSDLNHPGGTMAVTLSDMRIETLGPARQRREA